MSKRHVGAALAAAAVIATGSGTLADDATYLVGSTFRDCRDCPDMVVVPSGEFMMGTPLSAKEIDRNRGEGPQVRVVIEQPFAVGKTEVTHGQFKQFVRDADYAVGQGCRVWDGAVGFNNDPEADWLNRRQPARVADSHPVGCVSWLDAKAYVAWLADQTGKPYRLLSESEWEYAARGGTQTARFWGDASNGACQFANTFDQTAAKAYPFPWYPATCTDGYADLAPVGRFQPNPFGLHDMIGNVWEWTEDCFAATHIGRPTDGSAWVWEGGCDKRATRGGGWLSAPERNRIAWPGRDPEDWRNTQFGFRIARDLSGD